MADIVAGYGCHFMLALRSLSEHSDRSEDKSGQAGLVAVYPSVLGQAPRHFIQLSSLTAHDNTAAEKQYKVFGKRIAQV